MKNLVNQYATISEEQWQQVRGLVSTLKLKKGENFLSLGDRSDRFGVVEQGLFRIYYVDTEGKEAIKTFRSVGGLIGAYAEFLRDIPCRLSVEALCDSEVSVVKASDMVAVFKQSSHWERLGRKIAERLYLEKEEREYQFLCMDAKARYRAFLKEYKDDEDRIPDYMVASYLGITPVYLSKLKKEQ